MTIRYVEDVMKELEITYQKGADVGFVQSAMKRRIRKKRQRGINSRIYFEVIIGNTYCDAGATPHAYFVIG